MAEYMQAGMLVLVMGDDLAGVDDAFAEEVTSMEETSGRRADRLSTVSEATRHVASCGLFDPEPAVAVSSCLDALVGGTPARRCREELGTVLAANPRACVVMRMGRRPTGAAAERELVSAVKVAGGRIRVVALPPSYNRIPWLLGYADRHGIALSERAAKLVLECIGDGDVGVAAELVRSLGEEMNSMSRSELLKLVPSASESTYTRIRRAIVARDAVALRQCRSELPDGPQGDRTFASKARYATQKLLLASSIDWSRKDLLAHGKGTYGDRYARSLMSEAASSGGRERYARAYVALGRILVSMTGYGDGAMPDADTIIMAIVA